jgi:hypothetical protein
VSIFFRTPCLQQLNSLSDPACLQLGTVVSKPCQMLAGVLVFWAHRGPTQMYTRMGPQGIAGMLRMSKLSDDPLAFRQAALMFTPESGQVVSKHWNEMEWGLLTSCSIQNMGVSPQSSMANHRARLLKSPTVVTMDQPKTGSTQAHCTRPWTFHSARVGVSHGSPKTSRCCLTMKLSVPLQTHMSAPTSHPVDCSRPRPGQSLFGPRGRRWCRRSTGRR